MRKVESETVYPFLRRQFARVANSSTDGDVYRLHGNAIARHVHGGMVLSTAGWGTKTTGSRLRAIVSAFRPDVRVGMVKGSMGIEVPTEWSEGRVIKRKRIEFPDEDAVLFLADEPNKELDGRAGRVAPFGEPRFIPFAKMLD